jgi:TrmH family RNA methyltransferase
MKQISSRDNPDYRGLLRLARSARDRRAERRILLDGVHLIECYVRAFGAQALTLVLRASSTDDPAIRVWREAGERTLVLADSLFNEVSPVETPTGVLATAPLPDTAGRGAKGGFSVFLDGVQDPGNLGAIVRSAAAAGARGLLLSPQCADVWSPRALRGGMGAQFLLEIQDHRELVGAIRSFSGPTLAADARAEQSLFEVDLPGEVAFVVGAEGHGVSETVLQACRARVRIPMAAGVESLNAAAAATLLFYEWKRRQPGQTPDGGAPRAPSAGQR